MQISKGTKKSALALLTAEHRRERKKKKFISFFVFAVHRK